jgi:hypothetical protein
MLVVRPTLPRRLLALPALVAALILATWLVVAMSGGRAPAIATGAAAAAVVVSAGAWSTVGFHRSRCQRRLNFDPLASGRFEGGFDRSSQHSGVRAA